MTKLIVINGVIICTDCGESGKEHRTRTKGGKPYTHVYCRDCEKKRNKKYYVNNKNKFRESNIKYINKLYGTGVRKKLNINSPYKGVRFMLSKKQPNSKKIWGAACKGMWLGRYSTANKAAYAYNNYIKKNGLDIPLIDIVHSPENDAVNPNWIKNHPRLYKYPKGRPISQIIVDIENNTTKENREDNNLIVSILRGDKTAIGILFNKYQNKYISSIKSAISKIKKNNKIYKTTDKSKEPFDYALEGFLFSIDKIKQGLYSGEGDKYNFIKWSTIICINKMYTEHTNPEKKRLKNLEEKRDKELSILYQ